MRQQYQEPMEAVEDQIYDKRKMVRYDIRDMTIGEICRKYGRSLEQEMEGADESEYDDGNIFVPEYQRDFTWDRERQAKLIESLLLGMPIPPLFVAECRTGAWEIVDGSQRIRTVYAFTKNKLEMCKLQELDKLNGYSFQDLSPGRRTKFLNTVLRMVVLSEETTDEVKNDMFERINRGSDLLKPMETRKGIYKGSFNTFIYTYCAENKDFQRLTPLGHTLEKRQEREELLLRFFALTEFETVEKISVSSNGIAGYLDKYMDEKNKEWDGLSSEELDRERKKYKDKINRVVTFVSLKFPFGFRHRQNPQTKRSVFEAISVGVHYGLQSEKDSESLEKNNIKDILKSDEFRKYTHVAYQLHKKEKLQGRIRCIYSLFLES